MNWLILSIIGWSALFATCSLTVNLIEEKRELEWKVAVLKHELRSTKYELSMLKSALEP